MRGDKLFKKKLEKRLSQKSDALPKIAGVLGDGAGNLYFGDGRRVVYVRIGNTLAYARCARVAPKNDMAVWVGYANEEKTTYQILSARSDESNETNEGGGFAPANYYRYLAQGGGQDPLWLEKRAWLPLRPGTTNPPSMSVSIYSGDVWTGTVFLHVAAQTSDLTAHIPETDGNAAWVLLTINTSGAIVQTAGDETTIALLCPDGDEFANAPAIPSSTAEVVALVRVYYGQTAIREGRNAGIGDNRAFTDFVDLRGLYCSTSPQSTASAFQRNLPSDLTLLTGECLVVSGYLNTNGHDVIMPLDGDCEINIL